MADPAAELLRRAARTDRFWLLLLGLSLVLVEVLGAWAAPAYSYDRWDNYEYYTPMIAAAHRELVLGHYPVWNPHQHLGESFLANPQMGTLYPPYTLAYLAVGLFGLGWHWLCGLIGVSHIAFGAFGSYLLLRHFGVRASIAFIGALGLSSAGYLRAGAAFWIFLAPTFGWLPWTLLGAIHLVEGSRRARHAALFVVGLVAQAYIGHPQIFVYVWLTVGLVVLGYSMGLSPPWRERLRALARLGLLALAAGLLSAVSMLPILMHSEHTVRKTAVAFNEFVHASVSPRGLLGLLLPMYRARNGFIVRELCSFMLHQAAWVVPGLLFAGGVWLLAERRHGPSRPLGRAAAAFGVTGAVLMIFSLGRYGKLYGLTYAIPIWSSFRWPHKFLIVALPCLGIAAALGLELLAREKWVGYRTRLATSLALAGVGAMGFALGWANILDRPVAQLGLVCAVCLLVLAPFVDKTAVRGAMALASVGSAATMVMLAQTYAPHLIDEPHVLESSRYAPSGKFRVLTVDVNRERVQVVPRLIYQSATLLGVDSVTGCTTSMAPDWYTAWLPSNSRGLLPPEVYQRLLPSHFLRTLNVKVALAPRGNAEIDGWLRQGGFKLDRELSTVNVYSIDDPLPRAYFASQVLAYTPSEFQRGLWDNAADVRTAYVEAADPGFWDASLRTLNADGAEGPIGQVLLAEFGSADHPQVDVDSPEGGFLVLSMSYDPEWRATVDGIEVPLLRTNAMLLGLRVPPGRHQVSLRYRSRALERGVGLGGLGLALLGGGWALTRRGARSRPTLGPARERAALL